MSYQSGVRHISATKDWWRGHTECRNKVFSKTHNYYESMKLEYWKVIMAKSESPSLSHVHLKIHKEAQRIPDAFKERKNQKNDETGFVNHRRTLNPRWRKAFAGVLGDWHQSRISAQATSFSLGRALQIQRNNVKLSGGELAWEYRENLQIDGEWILNITKSNITGETWILMC